MDWLIILGIVYVVGFVLTYPFILYSIVVNIRTAPPRPFLHAAKWALLWPVALLVLVASILT